MKKRSFRSTFVSVILVITVAISIVNLAVYGINIKKIRQVEVLKMKGIIFIGQNIKSCFVFFSISEMGNG